MASLRNHLLLTTLFMALNFTLPILSTTTFQSGRLLAETSNSSSHLDDTVRVDPLDSFKKYRGGYDITNKHYWSSTAFTGIYGYAIAAAWLVCGVAYGVFLVVRRACKSRGKIKKMTISPCHRNGYIQPLLLALFLTLLAIMGIGLVLGGNAKFHSRAKTVIDIIIDTADEASDTIYNTTGAMKDMSTTLRQVNDEQATRFLSSTARSLDDQADDIARQASKNRRIVDKGLKIVYIITTVTLSLSLLVVIALLVLGVLKFRRTVQMLIALCWTFAVLFWVFFGVYFFLQNFVKDTCTAMESFQENPYNNTLSTIVPCDELVSAVSVLDDISLEIYNLVDQVNNNISTSYGNVVQICNPFSAPPTLEYQPWNCPASSIHIGDVPRVLRLLVCPDSEGQSSCNGGILVPANDYNRMAAYTTSIQKLLDVYPGMESLVQCQTVEDAFSVILREHCTKLKRDVRMVWGSLVFLAVVIMTVVLVWTTEVHHGQNHHSVGGSVKPHSATPDKLESGTAEG